MASAIDPDKKPNRAEQPGESGAAPAKPAAANSGAARPAAPRPAVRPAPAPQPQQRAQPEQPEQPEDLDRDRKPGVGASLLKQTPAWAVSMLVHIVALLAMALIVTEPPKKEAVVSIVSSAPEDDAAFEEISDNQPDTPVETTDPVADVAVTTDVVVEDVQVVADSNDVNAAPLAVEMSDFGDITAAATDMMSTIGVVGGTGKGFGGRKNATALAGTGGGGKDTEDAVDKALKWFIKHQLPDGGWDFDLKNCPDCKGECKEKHEPKTTCDRPGGPNREGSKQFDRSAATAMALLPFLGRGYTHQDGPYQQQMQRGIAYLAGLTARQQGRCYPEGGTMYSQGLAAIVLAEAYAMTRDEQLENPAQLALYFIEQAQDPIGGGWSYAPRQPGDTSIMGWQFMALKSGHMANLKINASTLKDGLKFLDSMEADSGAKYCYMAPPPKNAAVTAIGLLCRMYGGWDQDHPALERGIAFLASRQKRDAGDLYFNYYATQVMHHYGGDAWVDWNAKMKASLLPKQNETSKGHAAGSWYEGFEDNYGKPGRLYCTSLATLMLEVYYRHLPIYGNQVIKTNR